MSETSAGQQPRCGAMASRVDFGSSAAPCALPGGHEGGHATADGRVHWARRYQPSFDDVKAGKVIIQTPTGIYVPAHIADKLPRYQPPPGLYDPGLSMLATPVYILPSAAPRPRWWTRTWRRLTSWRRRA